MILSDTVRQALTAGHLAHLVTLNQDGSPQVSLALQWHLVNSTVMG